MSGFKKVISPRYMRVMIARRSGETEILYVHRVDVIGEEFFPA